MTTPGTTQNTVPPVTAAHEVSEFSYEPPEVGQEENLNALAADAIKDIAAEFQAEESANWLEENPEEGTEDPEAEVDPDADPEAEPEPEAEDEEVFDPKMANGIERVIARELAAKERETKAEGAVKAAEARIAELKGLEAKYEGLKSTKELAEMASHDPMGAIAALGHDPVTFVRLAMAQSLGDKAPPELQEFARDAARNTKIAALEAKLAQSERKAAEAAYFNTVSTEAQKYVNDPGTHKKYPTLAKLNVADSAFAHREIMEEIARDARERAAADPNGQHLSYEEAAKLVEKRAATWAKLLGNAPTNTKPAPGQAATQGKKPNATPPTTKAPARPLKPWEVKDDLQEQGFQEAMREFHRYEAAAKARR